MAGRALWEREAAGSIPARLTGQSGPSFGFCSESAPLDRVSRRGFLLGGSHERTATRGGD